MAQLRPSINTESWQGLYPFEPHTIDLSGDLSGCAYHFLDEGPTEGQTLLFVHGNPTWSFHWRRLIETFRGNYRCVAPDHLGCGLSDLQPRPLALADHIDNLVQLIDQGELQNITLVAQDWGGAIGLGALQQRLEKFARVVLFNTGAFPPWFIPWRIRVCRWPLFGKLALQGANGFSRAALRMTLGRQSRLEPAIEAAYLAPYHDWQSRAAVYQFVKDIPLSPKHPTWETLVGIDDRLPALADIPQLLVWGMQDWCFTPACLEKFAGYWPDAEVHRLADVGHWVVEDAAEQVEQLMADWLAKTSPVSGVCG